MAVLFDVDGTLVDTWELYIEAYLRTFETHLGRRLTVDELKALRPRSELGVLSRALPEVGLERAHGEFLRHYRGLHPERFGGVYPGAREVLEALRTRDLSLGVVTGKSRGAWQITRDAAELGGFDAVVCDDDVPEPKPSPAGLHRGLRALGAEPEGAVYVGDSVGDAEAARRAGVRFAAALWPKAPGEVDDFRRRVREAGAWSELERPEELLELLGPEPGTARGDGG